MILVRLLNHCLSRLEAKQFVLPDEHVALLRAVVEIVYLLETARGWCVSLPQHPVPGLRPSPFPQAFRFVYGAAGTPGSKLPSVFKDKEINVAAVSAMLKVHCQHAPHPLFPPPPRTPSTHRPTPLQLCSHPPTPRPDNLHHPASPPIVTPVALAEVPGAAWQG
jgi:hypothetical protein